MATLTMVFRLAQSAAQHWRLLNDLRLLAEVSQGIQFEDGSRNDAA